MLNCKIKNTEMVEPQDIQPFDIVTSPYMDIKGLRKIGLFLVVYKEANDPNDFNHRNVTGLKLTSKDLYANVYRTLVTTKDVPTLTNNSYIYANKFSTLLVDRCRYVAKLPENLCEEVLSKINIYLSQVQSQSTGSLIKRLKGE
jgi:hypothetical protein